MSYQNIIYSCQSNLAELATMVTSIEQAVLNEEDGSRLIRDNINFFTKSFLLTLCANLETCIKDVIYSFVADFEARLNDIEIPQNIIDWRYNNTKKQKIQTSSIETFRIGMSKKDIDDLVSGNVYKTRDTFLLVGVDLSTDSTTWERWKETIQSIVTRRNNIVHHNDDASDLSFRDINLFIDNVVDYLNFITNTCGTLSDKTQTLTDIK